MELSKAHTVPKDRPYSSTERSQPSMNWITVERELFVLDSIKVSGWGGVGWDGGGGEPDKYVTNLWQARYKIGTEHITKLEQTL